MKTRNKRLTLTTICLLSIQSLLAQIPVLEWAKQMPGPSNGQAESIAVDAYGNVYTTGYFIRSTDFNPGADTVNFTSAGEYDIFIQKLDANGNFIWAKQMGGTGSDFGRSITVDTSGNVYTTGTFEGTVDFDPGVDTVNFTSAGSYDIFIQKLDANGNFIWAKQMGGSKLDNGTSIAIDTSQNIYITGYFYNTADFDPGEGVVNLTSAGDYDIFVEKLDSNGNLLWVKQMGGSEWDQGNSIAIDASQNIYTTGYFTGTADFDPREGTENLTSAGYQDIFVLKLDTNGDFLWAKQMGGTDGDAGQSIAVDASGNVNIIGYFRETADFDPGEGTASLTSTGGVDIFVQKLDTNGNFLWVKQMGGAIFYGYSIALDTSGNVFTAGCFEGTADFDPGEGTANISSAKANNFIQKLDANGDFVWVRQMGGHVVARSIALDVSGNIYTTGYFAGTADFDPYEGEINLTSEKLTDIYVQKLYPCYPTDPVPDVPNLSDLSTMCEITGMDAPAPTATSNCVGTITASPDITFPITDQSITQIVWTYDDKNGNIVTQNQTIYWTPIDITVSLNGDTITANNRNGTYQWLNCDNDNAPIAGENDPLFIATTSGNYAVEITEECRVDTSECVSIIISSLGEFVNYEKLVVYPNPSTYNFKVEFGKVVKNAVLEVTNIQGKLVSSTQIQNSSETSIELNETPGIYLLTIKSKENIKTIRLIKK